MNYTTSTCAAIFISEYILFVSFRISLTQVQINWFVLFCQVLKTVSIGQWRMYQ